MEFVEMKDYLTKLIPAPFKFSDTENEKEEEESKNVKIKTASQERTIAENGVKLERLGHSQLEKFKNTFGEFEISEHQKLTRDSVPPVIFKNRAINSIEKFDQRNNVNNVNNNNARRENLKSNGSSNTGGTHYSQTTPGRYIENRNLLAPDNFPYGNQFNQFGHNQLNFGISRASTYRTQVSRDTRATKDTRDSNFSNNTRLSQVTEGGRSYLSTCNKGHTHLVSHSHSHKHQNMRVVHPKNSSKKSATCANPTKHNCDPDHDLKRRGAMSDGHTHKLSHNHNHHTRKKYGLVSADYKWEDYKNKVNITKQQFDEILEVFKEFDVNGDGVISRKEFYRMLRSIGQNPKEKEVDRLFDQLDQNNNNKIEFNELLKMVEHVMNSTNEDDETRNFIKQCYTQFDKSVGMKPYQSIINKKWVHTTKTRGLDVYEICTIIDQVKNNDLKEKKLEKMRQVQELARGGGKPIKMTKKGIAKAAKESRERDVRDLAEANMNRRNSMTHFADPGEVALFEQFKKEIIEIADMKSGFHNLYLKYDTAFQDAL